MAATDPAIVSFLIPDLPGQSAFGRTLNRKVQFVNN